MTPLSWLGMPLADLLPLAAGTGTAVMALYALRQRRRRLEVPFSPLWQKVLGQSQAQSLWQKLSRLLSLLLQLLLLGLFLGSLGDPRLGRSGNGRSIVLLMDSSASMQAIVPLQPGKTRLDLSRAAAQNLISSLRGDDLAVVVQLDGRPAPMGGFSDDEPELQSQLSQIQAKDTAADLASALRLSEALLRGRPNPQVVLFSDGGFDEKSLSEKPAGLDLRFWPVTATDLRPSDGNAAITSFAVRRYRRNRLSYEVLLQVAYFPADPNAQKPKAATLKLFQEGELVDMQKLQLWPGQQTRKLYPSLSGAGSHLLATLELDDNQVDLLPLDNQAFAVLPDRQRLKLLVVTPGNLFLEGALLAASAGEENHLVFEKVAPADYTDDRAAHADAVLFDGFTPAPAPAAHAIYLDPQGATSPFAITKTVTAPYVSDMVDEHPVLRWVSLSDLNMSRASVFRVGPFDKPLAKMLKDPIIVAREQPGPLGTRKSLAVGFDLRKSDLPLRVAFPVLLLNTLDWFAGDADQDLGSFRTGSTVVLSLHDKNREGRTLKSAPAQAVLTLPGGQPAALPLHEGILKLWGDKAGFYNVRVPELVRSFDVALNLWAPDEHAVPLRRQLHVGKQVLPPPDAGHAALKRTLWPLLLVFALLLLFLEWWTYHRRWTV